MKKSLKQTIPACFCALLLAGISTVPAHASSTLLKSELQQLQAALQLLSTKLKAPAPTSQVLGARTVQVTNNEELFAALADAQGGDVIRLAPGKYGAVVIQIPYNRLTVGEISKIQQAVSPESTVTVTSADPNRRAVIESIDIKGAKNWRFDNLEIRPSRRMPAVSMGGERNAIVNSKISFGDSPRSWTADEWKNLAGTGVQISGDYIEVGNNELTAVSFGVGITDTAQNAHVHHNSIVDFHADGIRIVADNARVEYNYIANVYEIDNNHDDGIQAWSYDPVTKLAGGPTLRGAIIRHNTIINSLTPHPLRGQMQGIGMFDGPYADFLVENNLVIVDHFHGITLGDPHNTIIRNNVVIDQDDSNKAGPLWISASPGKSKIATGGPTNVVISNNVANRYLNTNLPGNTFVDNVTMTTAEAKTSLFENFDAYDFRIRPGALAFSVGAAGVSGSVSTGGGSTNTGNGQSTQEPSDSADDEPVEVPTPRVLVNGISSNQTVRETINFAVVTRNFTNVQTVEMRAYQGSPTAWVTVAAPYTVNIDTKQFSNGQLKVIVRATDADGRRAQQSINLVVKNDVASGTPVATPPQSGGQTRDRVRTTDRLNVRSAPAGALLGLQSVGAIGERKASTKVQSNGMEWVYVDFESGVDGYVVNRYLTSANQQSNQPQYTVPTVSANFDTLSKDEKVSQLRGMITELQRILTLLLQS